MNKKSEGLTESLKPFTPEYFKYLYKQELKEITKNHLISVPKWKKDVLITLLEQSLIIPPTRQATRRTVIKAVKKATDLSFRKMRRAEK